MSDMLQVSIVIFLKDIHANGLKIWMQIRREDGPLDGLLEFPGGKIEAGESSEQAARREVFEEVGFIIPEDTELPLFITHPYQYKDRSINLHTHIAFENELPSKKGSWSELNFKDKSSILKGKIPEVNHIVIDRLLDHIQAKYNSGKLELS